MRRPSHCSFAVVGGGWAGIFAAWRAAIDARAVDPSQVCVFEASSRWGGRTYTVRGRDHPGLDGLNIDIGAYRFAHEQHLPSDLLTALNLSSACYLPSCSPEPLDDNLTLYKLMEPDGSTAAGYGTALDVMWSALVDAGATMLTGVKLDGVYPGATENALELRWAHDGAVRTQASRVLLNLPRHAVLSLAPDSLLFTAASAATRHLYNCSRALYQRNYTREASVKVYAVYDDAWCKDLRDSSDLHTHPLGVFAPCSHHHIAIASTGGTKLGLWEGEVREASDPPVYIRYHDGPLRCQAPTAAGGLTACKGALLAQYAHTNEEGGACNLLACLEPTTTCCLPASRLVPPGLIH